MTKDEALLLKAFLGPIKLWKIYLQTIFFPWALFEIIPFIVILSFRFRSKQCELDLAISWNQETNDNMQAILSIALSTKQEKLWQATWLSYILQPLGTRCYGSRAAVSFSPLRCTGQFSSPAYHAAALVGLALIQCTHSLWLVQWFTKS